MSDNEQTNKKIETVADILGEMRGMGNYQRYSGNHAHVLADRIEAAWKRERAKVEADALAVGGIVEAERTSEKSSAVGNAAAMREALLNIQEYADAMDVDDGNVLAILDACRDALSAPARNCDLARDWLQDLYCKFKPPATVRREMPPEWVDAVMAFCKWLLAPAAERKGETDGR